MRTKFRCPDCGYSIYVTTFSDGSIETQCVCRKIRTSREENEFALGLHQKDDRLPNQRDLDRWAVEKFVDSLKEKP